uniref:Uncharacterized protein n=1 Tax=Tetranychus urticae TaxID=32264 RepID=T1K3E1_TETUR
MLATHYRVKFFPFTGKADQKHESNPKLDWIHTHVMINKHWQEIVFI